MNLSEKKCVPCQGGVPPLKGTKLTKICEELGGNWELVEEHHIVKTYNFEDFLKAILIYI